MRCQRGAPHRRIIEDAEVLAIASRPKHRNDIYLDTQFQARFAQLWFHRARDDVMFRFLVVNRGQHMQYYPIIILLLSVIAALRPFRHLFRDLQEPPSLVESTVISSSQIIAVAVHGTLTLLLVLALFLAGIYALACIFVATHARAHASFFEYDNLHVGNVRHGHSPLIFLYAFYHHHHTAVTNWFPLASYYEHSNAQRPITTHVHRENLNNEDGERDMKSDGKHHVHNDEEDADGSAYVSIHTFHCKADILSPDQTIATKTRQCYQETRGVDRVAAAHWTGYSLLLGILASIVSKEWLTKHAVTDACDCSLIAASVHADVPNASLDRRRPFSVVALVVCILLWYSPQLHLFWMGYEIGVILLPYMHGYQHMSRTSDFTSATFRLNKCMVSCFKFLERHGRIWSPKDHRRHHRHDKSVASYESFASSGWYTGPLHDMDDFLTNWFLHQYKIAVCITKQYVADRIAPLVHFVNVFVLVCVGLIAYGRCITAVIAVFVLPYTIRIVSLIVW